jgi:hypothetical protein
MPGKIDPLNKKLYGSVTAMLTVTDVNRQPTFISLRLCPSGTAEEFLRRNPEGAALPSLGRETSRVNGLDFHVG